MLGLSGLLRLCVSRVLLLLLFKSLITSIKKFYLRFEEEFHIFLVNCVIFLIITAFVTLALSLKDYYDYEEFCRDDCYMYDKICKDLFLSKDYSGGKKCINDNKNFLKIYFYRFPQIFSILLYIVFIIFVIISSVVLITFIIILFFRMLKKIYGLMVKINEELPTLEEV